nr:MAG TPA: hypothetical protein [Caudoviricetes sp.]
MGARLETCNMRIRVRELRDAPSRGHDLKLFMRSFKCHHPPNA